MYVYHRQKSVINCQQNIEAMFFLTKVCWIVLRSRTFAQVSWMKNDQAAHPHTLLLTILNGHVTWFWQLGTCPLMKVAAYPHISHGSAHYIIRDNLSFRNIYAGYVPKWLTEKHKCHHLEICQHLLNHYHDQGDTF
jgi:hypothetical protein